MVRVGRMRLPGSGLRLEALPDLNFGIPSADDIAAVLERSADHLVDRLEESAKEIIDYGVERAEAVVATQTRKAVLGHIVGLVLSGLVFSLVVSMAASPAGKRRIRRYQTAP